MEIDKKIIKKLISALEDLKKSIGEKEIIDETVHEIEEIDKITLRINDILVGLFRGIGIKLVDFKIEYGKAWNKNENEILLADEISPDTCRLWDIKTEKKT